MSKMTTAINNSGPLDVMNLPRLLLPEKLGDWLTVTTTTTELREPASNLRASASHSQRILGRSSAANWKSRSTMACP